MGDELRGQHAGMAVISEGHKDVVNIRTAGTASKCSAGNAIRIRPNSLNTTIQDTHHSMNSSSSHSVNGDIAIQWEWSNFDHS